VQCHRKSTLYTDRNVDAGKSSFQQRLVYLFSLPDSRNNRIGYFPRPTLACDEVQTRRGASIRDLHDFAADVL
jgi:hypothetical protein